MDAKKELVARICTLIPECGPQVEAILAEYHVTKEPLKDKSNLHKRIVVFLAAKKIDGLAAKTLKNYKEMLLAFARQVNKPVARITTDDIRTYIAYLSQERHLKDSSIQTHINTLRSFFSWLDMEDIIKKDPMRKIKSLKIDRMKARRP